MIVLIVGILAFIISVVLIVFSIKEYKYKDGSLFISIVILFLTCLILPVSLVSGRSIYKQNNNERLLKREQIKYLLKNNTSMYVIEQAQIYNEDVDFGNNYWCRFTIEDRNEFKIDIDEYLKELEHEQKN